MIVVKRSNLGLSAAFGRNYRRKWAEMELFSDFLSNRLDFCNFLIFAEKSLLSKWNFLLISQKPDIKGKYIYNCSDFPFLCVFERNFSMFHRKTCFKPNYFLSSDQFKPISQQFLREKRRFLGK